MYIRIGGNLGSWRGRWVALLQPCLPLLLVSRPSILHIEVGIVRSQRYGENGLAAGNEPRCFVLLYAAADRVIGRPPVHSSGSSWMDGRMDDAYSYIAAQGVGKRRRRIGNRWTRDMAGSPPLRGRCILVSSLPSTTTESSRRTEHVWRAGKLASWHWGLARHRLFVCSHRRPGLASKIHVGWLPVHTAKYIIPHSLESSCQHAITVGMDATPAS